MNSQPKAEPIRVLDELCILFLTHQQGFEEVERPNKKYYWRKEDDRITYVQASDDMMRIEVMCKLDGKWQSIKTVYEGDIPKSGFIMEIVFAMTGLYKAPNVWTK